jgi:hypothetical protein
MQPNISFSCPDDEFSFSKLMSLREIKSKNSYLQKQIKKSLDLVQEEYQEILNQIENLYRNETNKRKLEIEFLKFTNPREDQSTLLYFLKNFTGGRNDLMPYEIENTDKPNSETDLDQQIKDFLNENENKKKDFEEKNYFGEINDPQVMQKGALESNQEVFGDTMVQNISKNLPKKEVYSFLEIKEEDFADFSMDNPVKKVLEIKEEKEFSHQKTSKIEYTNFKFEETPSVKEIELSVDNSDLEDIDDAKRNIVDQLDLLAKRDHSMFTDPLNVYPGGEFTFFVIFREYAF